MLALFVLGIVVLDVSTAAVRPGMGRLGEFVGLMVPPDPALGDAAGLSAWRWPRRWRSRCSARCWRRSSALAVGFLAASNVVAAAASSTSSSRRFLDTIRSVDMLIWALIWINVVGLGPFAGVLAIMTSAISARSASCSPRRSRRPIRKPVEGVASAGGSRLHGDPLRPAAAGVAGDREPGALLFRVQHPLGHHHRHRRRRRHRPAPRRADPHAGVAARLVRWC